MTLTLSPRIKRWLKILGGVAACWAVLAFIHQMWRLRYLSGDEFVDRATMISTIATTRYVGITRDRVYMEEWRMGDWSRMVYWTRPEELPAELVEQLRKREMEWREQMDTFGGNRR